VRTAVGDLGGLAAVVEALYPSRCSGCGRSGTGFCERCAGEVVVLEPPGCLRCGRPLARSVARCADCPPEPLAWSRSAFLYAGPLRSALMRLKFSGWRGATAPFVPNLARLAREAPVRTIAPTLTWVPLGRHRKRRRGFDQAQAIARAVARETGWPLRRLLRRVRETDPQARRGAVDRRTALSGAFVAVAPLPPPSLVIVVDDVLTTGSTGAACAGVLIDAGARTVGLLTLARALGGPVPGCERSSSIGRASGQPPEA
jgi:ComF family protein